VVFASDSSPFGGADKIPVISNTAELRGCRPHDFVWERAKRVPVDPVLAAERRVAIAGRFPLPELADGLSAGRQSLLSVLLETIALNGACVWSLERLGEEAVLCRTAVRRYLGEWVAAGWLLEERRPVERERSLTNRYSLNPACRLFWWLSRWVNKFLRFWRTVKPVRLLNRARAVSPVRPMKKIISSYVLRWRLFQASTVPLIEPGDIVVYADGCHPP